MYNLNYFTSVSGILMQGKMRPITLSQYRHIILPTETTFLNLREGEEFHWELCLSDQDRIGPPFVNRNKIEGNTCFSFQREISVCDGRVFARLVWQVSADIAVLPPVLYIFCKYFK